MMTLKEKIEALKRQRNAVILAHYYTEADVQDVADFVGDSLALSQRAATTDADVILFAGVHFMGETAKILSPQKTVLMPDMAAGCSLADSCRAEDFAAFIAQHPGHTVISYVNTTAEVKALTDIVCTSSNAVQIVQSLPEDEPIIFGPDRNLGNYIKNVTGRQNMVIWDGACHVHEEFSLEKILELKKEHPTAKILSHPECKRPIILISDYVGSTAGLLHYAATDTTTDTYIVVTEPGVLHQMKKAAPDKTFIPAPPMDSTCGCNNCSYMKLVTLQKMADALEQLEPQIVIPEETRVRAEKSIRRMLEISSRLGLV
ncbi:MAG TPA: quinolinate synthase NadA [Candidatus Rikenella faecigallinarum]|uniref:Quinolinate synthase n=1 Tax=Candidatus Rikenella faecigallinarum TaxID=2838745 RepID=A0A9D1TYT0_9BACT|nr:quinolinate synthase NadA [Candidatus Rikenella faecigallinarum]